MRVAVSDPVRDTLPEVVAQDFDQAWAEIGVRVKLLLQQGPPDTTWCNIGVTWDCDTTQKCTFHRTIATTGLTE